MDMNKVNVSTQNADVTAEELGSQFNGKTIANMAADPSMQDKIVALQDKAGITLSAIIDQTAALLLRDAERSLDKPRSKAAQQSRYLGMASKRRKQAWQKAREFAEMLVIGALINKDNPAWDPTDPSSCAAGGESVLLSLIRFDAEGADTHSSPAG